MTTHRSYTHHWYHLTSLTLDTIRHYYRRCPGCPKRTVKRDQSNPNGVKILSDQQWSQSYIFGGWSTRHRPWRVINSPRNYIVCKPASESPGFRVLASLLAQWASASVSTSLKSLERSGPDRLGFCDEMESGMSQLLRTAR